MKIMNKKNISVNFEDIKDGDVFVHNYVYYMKTEGIIRKHDDKLYNAVVLCSGQNAHFDNDTPCSLLDAELMVN